MKPKSDKPIGTASAFDKNARKSLADLGSLLGNSPVWQNKSAWIKRPQHDNIQVWWEPQTAHDHYDGVRRLHGYEVTTQKHAVIEVSEHLIDNMIYSREGVAQELQANMIAALENLVIPCATVRLTILIHQAASRFLEYRFCGSALPDVIQVSLPRAERYRDYRYAWEAKVIEGSDHAILYDDYTAEKMFATVYSITRPLLVSTDTYSPRIELLKEL